MTASSDDVSQSDFAYRFDWGLDGLGGIGSPHVLQQGGQGQQGKGQDAHGFLRGADP